MSTGRPESPGCQEQLNIEWGPSLYQDVFLYDEQQIGPFMTGKLIYPKGTDSVT